MPTYSITAAKTHLSRLVELAANGEPFIITKSGKPMVKFIPVYTLLTPKKKRFGFMAGQITVPDDFNTMGVRKIQKLFKDK